MRHGLACLPRGALAVELMDLARTRRSEVRRERIRRRWLYPLGSIVCGPAGGWRVAATWVQGVVVADAPAGQRWAVAVAQANVPVLAVEVPGGHLDWWGLGQASN